MRIPRGTTGRGVLGALAAAALAAVLPAAAPSPREAPRVPFEERYRATLHGGIARAANSAATCTASGARGGSGASPCRDARTGAGGDNGDYEMTYIDVDDDPNTYNSSRAVLRLPQGSRVTYARLYWGGNLRVGEQKPAADNGRVLIAEPGGRYKEVLADTVIGHRRTSAPLPAGGYDAYTASADVTDLVARSGGGLYTVGQLNVAKGRSPAGAWGGWTLVAAYTDEDAPMRHLVVMDGYEALARSRGGSDGSVALTVDGLSVPPGAAGSAGVVAYDGDRGASGESFTVRAAEGRPYRVGDAANPADNFANSTITDHGRPAPKRRPLHGNTLGYDSDVYDIGRALTHGGRALTFRFAPGADDYHLGALFMQVDARG